MEYEFTVEAPITEEEALARVAERGWHGLAFDVTVDNDEELHWHEFAVEAWVISGSGSFADQHGNVTEVSAGCHLKQPAGHLHRDLAGTRTRVVIGTDIPFSEWTQPIDKPPVPAA